MSTRDSGITGGYTPLMMACEEGKLTKVKTLLPNPGIDDKNQVGYTALGLAVKNGHLEVAKELIVRGSNPQVQNNAGQSILFIACWNNNDECVKLLLDNKVDVNACDQRGWTPLIISVYHNYTDIVQILLKAGADKKQKDCFGKIAIDRAKSPEMIAQLSDEVPTQRRSTPNRLRASQTERPPAARRSITANSPKRAPARTVRTNPSPQTARRALSTESSRQKVRTGSASASPKRMERSLSNPRQASPFVSEADKRRKFRDEMDAHIKATTNQLGSRVVEQSFAKLQENLNEEMLKAEELIKSDIDVMLSKQCRTQATRIKENSIRVVEEALRQHGYAFSESQIRNVPFSIDVGIKKHRGTYSVQDSPKMYTPLTQTPSTRSLQLSPNVPDDMSNMKEDLTAHIENCLVDMGDRIEQVQTENFQDIVDDKVCQLRDQVIGEVQNAIESLGQNIYSQIENAMNQRIREIVGEPEQRSRQLVNLRIEERRNPEETIPRRVPSNDGRFQNYSQQHSYSERPSAKRSPVKDMSNTMARANVSVDTGKRAKPTAPRTSVSESLRQFLQTDETYTGDFTNF